MLVLQVGRQLQLKHISYNKDSVSANQHSSSAMVQMTTVTRPLIAKQVPGEQWECEPVARVFRVCSCTVHKQHKTSLQADWRPC